MLLIFNPQNYGKHADKIIGYVSGCARVALAKDISAWKNEIMVIGAANADPANQVVDIVLEGLMETNRVIQLEQYCELNVTRILKERGLKNVRVVGSSDLNESQQIMKAMAALCAHGIEAVVGELLDLRQSLQAQPVSIL